MLKSYALEYWVDEGWYVGRLLEVPGVFSQGETLSELEENIQDAYPMMIKKQPSLPKPTRRKQLVIQD